MFLSIADQAAITLSYRRFVESGRTIEDHILEFGYPDEMDARTSLAYGELLSLTVFKNHSDFELKDLI